MKKKKEFEAFCNKNLKKLQGILLLDSFILRDIKYKEADDSYATCVFSFPYKEIQITYSKSLYDDWESGDIRSTLDTLTHEMCHVVTDPIYSVACDRFTTKGALEDSRENVTDHIANFIIRNNLI